MPGAFQGINTLSSALEAFQTQIDITGQNIANVNTPGYNAQRVNLVAAPSTQETDGATVNVGNGVTIDSITRIQSSYLTAANNTATADLGKANVQAQTTGAINSIVADPTGAGLGSQIDGLYNAFSSLASDPSNANKLAVQQAAQTLASTLNGTYGSMDQVKQSSTQQLQGLLQQVQSDVNQIASLNASISKGTIDGSPPNDLMDARDQAVNNLSSLMNVSVQKSADGTESISSGNLILVDQSGARTVPTKFDTSTGTLSNSNGSYSIQSGQVAGLMDSINKVNSYETSLNTLANGISSSVNTAYATASDSSGNTGQTFFTGTGAQSIGLSSTIQANPNSILVGTSGNASDTGVAQQIANLATASQTALGNTNPSSYYTGLVSQIGADGQTATSSQSVQQSISAQVTSQIQSVSGVNVDTEMSNLLRFQSSYQAAAQALAAINQTTQTMLSTLNG